MGCRPAAAALFAAACLALAAAPAWGDPPVRLAAVGDLAFGIPHVAAAVTRGADPFAALDGTLADADVTFANLESVLTDVPTPPTVRERRGEPVLRGPPAAIAMMRGAGIDVVSVANNHALDGGADGLRDSLARVREAGIGTVGAGADRDAARAPWVTVVRGVRIGVLAFASGTNQDRQDGARVALVADDPSSAVRALRPRVDVLLVSMHWGEHYRDAPTAFQRTLAHQLVDAGADAILGHHPHVLQGVEVYRHRVVAYSLGNFVFGPQSGARGMSAVLRLELVAGAEPVVAASLVSVVLRGRDGAPMVSLGTEGDGVRERLRAASAELGTVLADDAGKLVVRMR